MAASSTASAASAGAAVATPTALLEAYRRNCAAFQSQPMPEAEAAFAHASEELVASPAAAQVAPLVLTLTGAGCPVPNLALHSAPGVGAAAEALASALRAVGRLKVIGCDFRGASVAAFAKGVAALPAGGRTAVLDVSGNGMGAKGAAALAAALPSGLPALQALNMEGNPLGGDGSRALVPLLAAPGALRVLCLRGTGVDDGGAAALAGGLAPRSTPDGPASPPLRVLDLSDNALGGTGVVALCTAAMAQLSVAVTAAQAGQAPEGGLQELLLAGCPLSPPALQALGALLNATADVADRAGEGAAHAGLSFLDVSGCSGSGGAAAAPARTFFLAAVARATAACAGALTVEGAAELQAKLEAPPALPPSPAAVAVPAPAQPSPAGGDAPPRSAVWGGIMARMQGAVAALAAADAGQPLAVPSTAPAAAPAAPPGGNTSTGTGAPPVAGVDVEALVEARVGAAVALLRDEFAADIGTLLSEVAATAARVERLEGVVREEQAASMALMETLMASMGLPPPPRA